MYHTQHNIRMYKTQMKQVKTTDLNKNRLGQPDLTFSAPNLIHCVAPQIIAYRIQNKRMTEESDGRGRLPLGWEPTAVCSLSELGAQHR